MPDASPDDLQPVGLHDKYAYVITIGLLHQEPVQDFIDQVRAREGITPPENAEELAYNLEHYPTDELEAEAFEFMLTFVEEPTPADLGKIDPQQIDVGEYLKKNPLLLTPPGMLQPWLEAIIPTEDIRLQAARVIARHIVVGFMELPEPFSQFNTGCVLPLEQQGMPLVMMVAGPGCNLDDLIRTFRDTCREMFGTGQRQRGPDKAVKTAWQRAMEKYLRRQGEDEGRIDHKVAELSFEVWPETKPPFDEASPEYEDAIRAEADRFRANSANYSDWIDEHFPDINAES